MIQQTKTEIVSFRTTKQKRKELEKDTKKAKAKLSVFMDHVVDIYLEWRERNGTFNG